jgi:hypothetical protein
MSSNAPRQLRASEPAGPLHAPAADVDTGLAQSAGNALPAWSDSPRQLKQGAQMAQLQAAETSATPAQGGLPQGLRQGIESLSGLDMSGVRVHRNSSKPAALQAHAYAQGQDIHLGPGQEKHLPHEAWHVVQQAQGRVRPTVQMHAGVRINDDAGLEREADLMGRNAMEGKAGLVSDTVRGMAELIGSVSQLTRIENRHPRADEDPRETAPPFQLATVQFDGAYDIAQYAVQIRAYFDGCSQSRTIPEIELRMYDAALPDALQQYLKEARKSISALVGHNKFDLCATCLRDETQEPQEFSAEESDEIESQFLAFVEWLRSANDADLQGDDTGQKMLRNQAERQQALNQPAEKMLSGRMMIPFGEAIELCQLPGPKLTAIYDGSTATRFSLHHRLLAKVLLLNPDTRSAAVRPVARTRRNSMLRPDSVCITNLVTGTETSTLESTVQACKAAFAKHASKVFLIIEAASEAGGRRAAHQIAALRESGYIVEFIEQIEARGVQQSGVMLGEPGEQPPQRIKVCVRRPKVHEEVLLAEGHPRLNRWLLADREQAFERLVAVYTYKYWYTHQVGNNLEEADEFYSTYFPQYLDHICHSWPEYVVHVRDSHPDFFQQCHDHHRTLYERQLQLDAATRLD